MAEQTVEETKPGEPEAEPESEGESLKLPSIQELEPIEDFSELFPEPQEKEVTPPEVESTPELTLNVSTRPMRRLFQGARYRFGRCVETIIDAIEFAMEGGAPRLDIGHFGELAASGLIRASIIAQSFADRLARKVS